MSDHHIGSQIFQLVYKICSNSKESDCYGQKDFKNLDIEDFRLLYKTYIRPRLEFCIQAWSLHFVKDITILEMFRKRQRISY